MLNKATLIGNLGADPEVRAMPNGDSVVSISLATTRKWKDKQTGERKEAVEWHRVIFFRRLADVAGEYLKKGSTAYIEGRLQTRKWQDQNGVDRYTTEIIAEELKLLGSKDKVESNNQTSQGNVTNAQPPLPDYQDFDDDINF